MRKILKSLTLFFLIFCFGFSFGSKPIFAELSKPSVQTGEIFVYTVKIEGFFNNPTLTMPSFNGLSVVSQSQSKSYIQINGDEKLLVTFNVGIFANKPGIFKIEPAILEDNNIKIKSKALTIKVIGKPLKEKMKIQPYLDSGVNL